MQRSDLVHMQIALYGI